MKDKPIAVMFGCGCLTAIVLTALYKGIDGTIYTPAIIGISVLVGYLFGKVKAETKI